LLTYSGEKEEERPHALRWGKVPPKKKKYPPGRRQQLPAGNRKPAATSKERGGRLALNKKKPEIGLCKKKGGSHKTRGVKKRRKTGPMRGKTLDCCKEGGGGKSIYR